MEGVKWGAGWVENESEPGGVEAAAFSPTQRPEFPALWLMGKLGVNRSCSLLYTERWQLVTAEYI